VSGFPFRRRCARAARRDSRSALRLRPDRKEGRHLKAFEHMSRRHRAIYGQIGDNETIAVLGAEGVRLPRNDERFDALRHQASALRNLEVEHATFGQNNLMVVMAMHLYIGAVPRRLYSLNWPQSSGRRACILSLDRVSRPVRRRPSRIFSTINAILIAPAADLIAWTR